MGTPESDALSQITTGSSSPPVPTPELEIASVVRTAPDTIDITYTAGGGAGATSIELQWRLPGEEGFPHGTSATPPVQTLQNEGFDGVELVLRTLATSPAGQAFGAEVTTTP